MTILRRGDRDAADDPVVSALADLDFDFGDDSPGTGPLGWIGIPDAEPLLGDVIEVRVRIEPGCGGRRTVSVEAQYSTADSRREALLAAVLVLVEDLRGRPL